jgi:hypothetical protein
MANAKYFAPIMIQVAVGGKTYSGSYTNGGGIVTVEWEGWADKTQTGTSAEATGKQLLRELVRKHRP